MAKKQKTISKKTKTKKRKRSHCQVCPSTCCHDLAMMITRPQNKTDLNELSWYLHYDTVTICIRNHRWYLAIKGRCIYLTSGNLCKIYEKRPVRCRRHDPPDCERFGSWHDVVISTPEELTRYLKKRKK